MMDFLSHIGALSRRRAESIESGSRAPSLAKAIVKVNSDGYLALIAEYKRASPSGVIRLDLDPWTYFTMLKDYAAAFSVLVEPLYFLGSPHLVSIAVGFGKPVLYKDFVVSRGQVDEAARLGASSILLIAKLLGDSLCEMADYSRRLGLEPLIEVDSLEDAFRVLDQCPGTIIGVNSRDLGNLSVSVARAKEVVSGIRAKADLIVAESGVGSVEDARTLAEAGANAILVGTALMRRPELGAELGRVRLTSHLH